MAALSHVLYWYRGGIYPIACSGTPQQNAPGAPRSRWMASLMVAADSDRLFALGFFDSCAGNLRYAAHCPRGALGDAAMGDGTSWLCLGEHALLRRSQAVAAYFTRPAAADRRRACEGLCVAGGALHGNGTEAGVPTTTVYCTTNSSGGGLGDAWGPGAPLPHAVLDGALALAPGGHDVVITGGRGSGVGGSPGQFRVLRATWPDAAAVGAGDDACVPVGWAEDELVSWPARAAPVAALLQPAAGGGGAVDPAGMLLVGGGVALMAADSKAAMADLWVAPNASAFSSSRRRAAEALPAHAEAGPGEELDEHEFNSMWVTGGDMLAALRDSPGASPTGSPSASATSAVSPSPGPSAGTSPSPSPLPSPSPSADAGGLGRLETPLPLSDDLYFVYGTAWYTAPSRALLEDSGLNADTGLPLAAAGAPTGNDETGVLDDDTGVRLQRWQRRRHLAHPWVNTTLRPDAPADMLVTFVGTGMQVPYAASFRASARGGLPAAGGGALAPFPFFIGMESATRRMWRVSPVPCQHACANPGNGFLGAGSSGGDAVVASYTLGCVTSPTDAACIPCSTCTPGVSYVADAVAHVCGASARHVLGYADTLCTPCTRCPAGSVQVSACGGTADTVCLQVPATPSPAAVALALDPLTRGQQQLLGAAAAGWSLLVLLLAMALAVHAWLSAKEAVRAAAASAASSVAMPGDGSVDVDGGSGGAGGVSDAGGTAADGDGVAAEARAAAAAAGGPVALWLYTLQRSSKQQRRTRRAQLLAQPPDAAADAAPRRQRRRCCAGAGFATRMALVWTVAVSVMLLEAGVVLLPLYAAVLQLLLLFPLGALFRALPQRAAPMAAYGDTFDDTAGLGLGILICMAAAPALNAATLLMAWHRLSRRPGYRFWARTLQADLAAFIPRAALWLALGMSLWRPKLLLGVQPLGLAMGSPVRAPSTAVPWRRAVRRAALAHAVLVDLPLLVLLILSLSLPAAPLSRWATLPICGMVLQLAHLVDTLLLFTRAAADEAQHGAGGGGAQDQAARLGVAPGGGAGAKATRSGRGVRVDDLLARLLGAAARLADASSVGQGAGAGGDATLPAGSRAAGTGGSETRPALVFSISNPMIGPSSAARSVGDSQRKAGPAGHALPAAPASGEAASECGAPPGITRNPLRHLSLQQRGHAARVTVVGASAAVPTGPEGYGVAGATPAAAGESAPAVSQAVDTVPGVDDSSLSGGGRTGGRSRSGAAAGFVVRNPSFLAGDTTYAGDVGRGGFGSHDGGTGGSGAHAAATGSPRGLLGEATATDGAFAYDRTPSGRIILDYGEHPHATAVQLEEGGGMAHGAQPLPVPTLFHAMLGFPPAPLPFAADAATLQQHQLQLQLQLQQQQHQQAHAQQHGAHVHAAAAAAAAAAQAALAQHMMIAQGHSAGTRFTPLQVFAMQQQLQLRAQASGSPQARRLAAHDAFFRNAPALLAAALSVISLPQLPLQWRQLSELLDTIDGEDDDEEEEGEEEDEESSGGASLRSRATAGGVAASLSEDPPTSFAAVVSSRSNSVASR